MRVTGRCGRDAAQSLDANPLPGRELPPVEQVRLLNAAARLMDVYQNGLLVHHKIRHGATQTVIVKQQAQQVQVNDGGQAVVTGTVGKE